MFRQAYPELSKLPEEEHIDKFLRTPTLPGDTGNRDAFSPSSTPQGAQKDKAASNNSAQGAPVVVQGGTPKSAQEVQQPEL